MGNKSKKSWPLIVALLLSNIHPAYACSSGYTVAYLNGVWNTVENATDSSDALATLYPSKLNGIPVTQQLLYNIFGCAGNNGGFSNWYIWDNAQSIASSTLDTAWVYFTNGIFQGGNGNKYITGTEYP